MEITGKIIQINQALTGQSARGEWKKQEVIIETEEQFPKKVCLINWNDKVDISTLTPGTKVNIGINIESREFNGRWFTDVKMWKLDIVGNNAGNTIPDNDAPLPEIPDENDPFASDNDDDDGLPF